MPERLLLFCLASDADWQAASITHATAQHMMVRGLIERDRAATRYALTAQGRAVLAALLGGATRVSIEGDYYESVVVNYIRSDRSTFVNTECCVQLNQSDNPDTSGPHWYCDAVACDFRNHRVLLCEISYSAQLSDLSKRLKGWHDNWDLVNQALVRDSFVPKDWQVRPWLFVPQDRVPLLVTRLEQIRGGQPLKFAPLITTLEMVQPWCYRWNRFGEKPKPPVVPEAMQS